MAGEQITTARLPLPTCVFKLFAFLGTLGSLQDGRSDSVGLV